MRDPRTAARVRLSQRRTDKELSRWGIVPVPTTAELRKFAEFADLSASPERLADVSDALAVVTRMLVGEGIAVQVRETERGMRSIGVIAHVLVSRSEKRRYTHWAGTSRPLADRLERVLSRRARQRLMSWYWATVVMPPPLTAFSQASAFALEEWINDSSGSETTDPPELVRKAQTFLASPDFRWQIARRATRSHTLALEAILSRQGARDFYTGELILVRRLFQVGKSTSDVQFHHLIPRKWWRVNELRADLQEQVRRGLANLTPIANATNRAVKNHAPATYLDEFAKANPDERAEGINAILREHLIQPDLLWAIDDTTSELEERVERFLDARLDAIVAAFGALVAGKGRIAEAHSA